MILFNVIMTERDKFYFQLPNYQHICNWKKLVDELQLSDAIAYWKLNRLDKNAYVKKGHIWIPVVYYCCLDARKAPMVKKLLSGGCDIDKLPDGDKYDYLPFVCNSLFLTTISSLTKHHPYKSDPILTNSIDSRINCGDSNRLTYLLNLGLLNQQTIIDYINDNGDIILNKLQRMIKYLTYCYTVRGQSAQGQGIGVGESINLKQETISVINKFATTFEFLIQYGAPCTEEACNFCIDHYLHELTFMTNYTVMPVYHTQKNSTTAAILRPLLNDMRYVKTCALCKVEPDKDVYEYNICT
jgi:hypothetical protein